MNIRKYPLLLLIVALFFVAIGSVGASPHPQDPQDALIRQVLNATIDDLGWNASKITFNVSDYGSLYRTEDYDYLDTAYIGVFIYDSANAAEDAYLGRLEDSFSPQQFLFHGHAAALWANDSGEGSTTMWVLMDRFFVFVQAELGVEEAKNSLEVFYQNAVAYGLITGNNDDIVPITKTLSPTITETPTSGSSIELKTSLKGFGEATQTISNAQNHEVIIVTGQVTDQEGKGIGGANVEVVSGANPAAISTNADGTYSLVINISSGQGNGSIGGVNFTLQLEGDLSIQKIILVQAVSGAELADSKHTVAIVFPNFSNQAQSSVDTQVTLYVNGQFLQTLPFRVKNNYSADEHRKVYDALKFFIPPSFVRTGVFEVKAVIDPDNTFVEPDETNNEKIYSEMVSSSRGLSMVMVALSPDIRAEDTQAWASTARRFLASTYPVPAVRIVQHPVYSSGWLNSLMAIRDAAIVNSARMAYNAANPTSRVEYAVGLYPPSSYGAGNRGLVYRFLYPQAPLVSLEFPITIAHEIGHVHLGGREEVDDNPNLGGVSLPEGYVYNYITGQVRFIKPNSNWINFMGDPYAGFELGSVTVIPWISPTASNTILGVRQTATSSEPKMAILEKPNWSATALFEKVLYISGYFDNGELNILPPQTLNTNEVGDYPAGDFMASVLAADGSILANVSFEVNYDSGEYNAANPGAFQFEIPYPAEAFRFVITKDGEELYWLSKSDHSPTVTVDQPGNGNPVDSETIVTWSAADEDSDTLTYNVFYSPDGGASWQLIGLGWNNSNIPMDGSLLSSSDQALIRVVASDGLNTGYADSPTFIVPNHAPKVMILPPAPEAEPWVVGHPNLLAATAEDIEDGLLLPESYQWSSDKDGVLGQGNALYVALSEGEHTITIVVTDNDGQQASESTMIAVSGVNNDANMSLLPNNYYLFAVGTCIAIGIGLVIGGVVYFSRRRKWRLPQHQSQAAGQAGAIQDAQGNWWSQDPNTGRWSFWNGQVWQVVPTTTTPPPSRLPSQHFKTTSKSGSWFLTFILSGLVALLVFGAVSLIRFNFIPGQTIQPAQNITFVDILKMGGGGFILSLLGFLMFRGGIKSILFRRALVEDEWGRQKIKRGCSAILAGISQSFFGFLLLTAGIGLMTLSLYQQILPWLGIL